jgi:hypothetical protein
MRWTCSCSKKGTCSILDLLGVFDGLRTSVGYDDVTGLGTPNGDAFLQGLS